MRAAPSLRPGAAVEVRLLGPLELADGGRLIAYGGARQRAVLALLVLHANQVVPSERVLLELWGEDTPPGTVGTNTVSELLVCVVGATGFEPVTPSVSDPTSHLPACTSDG
jgi:hypothetical protein